ncbi:MAG: thioredoxin reductase [Propionibacteriaceae bacterium]|jgi:thioredoxin reductase (NADPH)|nr:thioredoxin reductase [Propionibacteriaceae bacterium]
MTTSRSADPASGDSPVATQETPDTVGAYPRLTEAQLDVFKAVGQSTSAERGEVLARAGEKLDDFIIVLEGRILVADDEPQDLGIETGNSTELNPEGLHVEVHGPGRFLGDIGLLEGQPSFSTVVALEPSKVLKVPKEELQRIVLGDPIIGDLILRAWLIRRAMAIGAGSGLRIIGSCFSPRTRELLDFAARNRVPHKLMDPDKDPSAESMMQRFGLGVDELPLVIVGGSRMLRNPSVATLAAELGLRPHDLPSTSDVLIVGAGPAGLAAAVYAASDGLSVVLNDAVATGGQAARSARIENYLGFPAGISGSELAERAAIQARKFGATLYTTTAADRLEVDGHVMTVHFSDDTSVSARTVVVASGVRYNRIPAEGLERFEYSCVFYAATIHEARVCGDNPVVVVGGGNSAGQAAVFLANTVQRVHLVVRGPSLDENMSRYLVAQIVAHPRITIHLETELVEAHGDKKLEEVVVRDRKTGTQTRLDAKYVFVFIGAAPATSWLPQTVARDENGYLLTGPDAVARIDHSEPRADRRRFPLETSMSGVFAVGDVRSGSVKRMSAAVGEGASVVRLVHEYLDAAEVRF